MGFLWTLWSGSQSTILLHRLIGHCRRSLTGVNVSWKNVTKNGKWMDKNVSIKNMCWWQKLYWLQTNLISNTFFFLQTLLYALMLFGKACLKHNPLNFRQSCKENVSILLPHFFLSLSENHTFSNGCQLTSLHSRQCITMTLHPCDSFNQNVQSIRSVCLLLNNPAKRWAFTLASFQRQQPFFPLNCIQ